MKYAAEMGSGDKIYITTFIKTGSGIQKLTRRNRRHRHTNSKTPWRLHKPTLAM
jgi:hypothetical protein